MPARAPSSSLMRPFVVLALPGMYLLYKYNQYRQQQMETARRRVTERELMHLNTKIDKPPCDPRQPNPPCRRAYADITPAVDPNCPRTPERSKKKKGILHKIKLHMTEGGTNFGTPFRWLECKPAKAEPEVTQEEAEESKALVETDEPIPPLTDERRAVQVAILGADTAIGQYAALLLKQCSCIRKLSLYESKDSMGCTRNLCNVVQDLKHINTNCRVQAFSCACCELERCLQNSDIVLMLDSGHVSPTMSLEDRFACQAPLVKCYTEAIINECPKAFIIVCATPIDCMVPIVAETLRTTGWYDPAKVLGSLAVPEMRASTMAAQYLGLDPRYTRVPCVGGTEGETLVPLFSRALEFHDFCETTAEYITNVVRRASVDVLSCEGHCVRAADLSEAHALTGLVTKVAHALLCCDIPTVTGFVETDSCQIVSPAKYLAIDVLLNQNGICHHFDIPHHLSSLEMALLVRAFSCLERNVHMANSWFAQILADDLARCKIGMKTQFFNPKNYEKLKDCTSNLV